MAVITEISYLLFCWRAKGRRSRVRPAFLGTAQNPRAPLQALRQGLRGYFLPSAQTRGRRAASVQVPPSQTLRQGLGGCLLPPSSPSARLGGNFCRRRRPAGGGLRRSRRPPLRPFGKVWEVACCRPQALRQGLGVIFAVGADPWVRLAGAGDPLSDPSARSGRLLVPGMRG